ncbi:MAG: YfiR family protein [Terriglobales bacterium]
MASVAAILAIALSGTVQARAAATDGPTSSEYLIKAGFIYNFAKFIQWPESAFAQPNSPIVIGILGSDPFGSVMDRIVADKTIGGRGFVVRRLTWGKDSADLKNCAIVFVSSSEHKNLHDILLSLKGLPILTIGDTPDFAQKGGIIGFTVEDNRIRFEINVAAARLAQLVISSRLLTLAKIVSAAAAPARSAQ